MNTIAKCLFCNQYDVFADNCLYFDKTMKGSFENNNHYKTSLRGNGQLSKPQPNLNKTVGFYTKMTLQPPPPTTHPHKLKVSNISAVNDPILMKL